MASASSRGIGAFLKKSWNEYPDLVGSAFMGTVGFFACLSGLYYYYKVLDGDNRRYKDVYTVIRHDDPKVATLRTDFLGDIKK